MQFFTCSSEITLARQDPCVGQPAVLSARERCSLLGHQWEGLPRIQGRKIHCYSAYHVVLLLLPPHYVLLQFVGRLTVCRFSEIDVVSMQNTYPQYAKNCMVTKGKLSLGASHILQAPCTIQKCRLDATCWWLFPMWVFFGGGRGWWDVGTPGTRTSLKVLGKWSEAVNKLKSILSCTQVNSSRWSTFFQSHVCWLQIECTNFSMDRWPLVWQSYWDLIYCQFRVPCISEEGEQYVALKVCYSDDAWREVIVLQGLAMHSTLCMAITAHCLGTEIS